MTFSVGNWFFVFLLAIVISVFMHEVGHGISAYVAGHPVSTGFNRVGDAYRKPGDPDFREKHSTYQNPWDLGSALTLLLAVVFTVVITKMQRPEIVFYFGALALANSFIRLIPMTMSYFALIFRGRLPLEDETVQGQLWYEMTGITFMKYLPSLLALVISTCCLFFIIKAFKQKIPHVVGDSRFIWISIASFIVAMPILQVLDRVARINWTR